MIQNTPFPHPFTGGCDLQPWTAVFVRLGKDDIDRYAKCIPIALTQYPYPPTPPVTA
jgi:hypothetical protein